MANSPFMKLVNSILGRKTSAGYDIPTDPKEDAKDKKEMTMAAISVAFFILSWIFLNFIKSLALQFQQIKRLGQNVITMSPNYDLALHQALDLIHHSVNPKYLIICAIAGIIFAYGFTKKMNFVTQKVAYGQKGDSRFTTIKELEQQYPLIPDHERRGG